MKYLRSILVIVFPTSLFFACNNPTNKAKENNATQTTAVDTAHTMPASTTNDIINKVLSDTSVMPGDKSESDQNVHADSLFSQLKGFTSILGKGDSGLFKNLGGGNMDSMMKKFQSMAGGKGGNPGELMSNLIANYQLGQMKDDNPLKQVAKGMQQAQENGTAGPDITYTATYAPEQPADYTMPVSGNGNTIMLQYTGGSINKGKKDGLWKNIYVSTNTANKWNVYTEAYAELSEMNMKVHSTSLAGLSENYTILLNDQYKKYSKQPRSDFGRNDFDVQVKKIGNEKIFGYNCVHVQITYTVKALKQTEHVQDDEWYSAEVPGAQFLSPVIFESHSPAVVKKIIDIGCKGALVKSVSPSNGSSQLIQLSSIVKKDMPDTMFNLPANYQEDKNTAMYGLQ